MGKVRPQSQPAAMPMTPNSDQPISFRRPGALAPEPVAGEGPQQAGGDGRQGAQQPLGVPILHDRDGHGRRSPGRLRNPGLRRPRGRSRLRS